MQLFQRKSFLPNDLVAAWQGFLDCAQVIESGRRVLLSTLPTGRIEPAPIGIGLDALRGAITDARGWMPRWKVDLVIEEWQDCHDAMDQSFDHLDHVADVAASTGELEELLEAVTEVIAPLDAFADAERAWRRSHRIPG